MADTPHAWTIMQTLQARLQEIRVANDYRTDAGADVRVEKSQLGPGARLTIYAQTTTRPEGAMRNERELVLIIEGTVPVELEDAQQQIVALAEDVEQALDGFVYMPGALPLAFQESLFLDCPEGMPAMAVQLMFGTRYRR